MTSAVLALLFAAQAPSIEQSMNLKTIGAPVISPDAKWIAWTETSTDWEQNAYITHVWVARRDTGERRQLTSGKKSATAPRWAPDSTWLAFGSDRDGRRQIYAIAPDGGEARALTSHETAVGGFDISPDGKTLAFTAPEPESKSSKDRKEKYGEFEIVEGDYRNSILWTVPTAGDKPKAQSLTKADLHVTDLAWSPDGKSIAFTAAKDPDLSHRGTTDLYLADLASRETNPLVAGPGIEGDPVWSPDATQVAYTVNPGEPNSYLNSKLKAVRVADGASRSLAVDFDENPQIAAWCREEIYFFGFERGSIALYRAAASSTSHEKLAPAGPATLSRDCGAVAFSRAEPSQPSEIYATDVTSRSWNPKKFTDQAAQWRPYRTAVREVIQWKSKDGATIEGVLIKPRDFDPAKRYPLLVVIHGGPTGIDTPALTPDRYYPIEQFVAKGALVLRPNYRGSAGYGEKFRSLNVRNLGVGDAWDVISGVDHLIAKGWVDGDRVGAMGWSQGGYISAFLTCSSDRFKAISVGAGISDWMTYYVNTDIHPFTRTYLKATPWDDPEIYRKTSPISYVKSAKTPTLIQHGELDKRVPPPNAYELYQALKDRGVESRLVIYKGFGHGIDKPKQQRHVLEENERWFDRYVLAK